MKVLSPFATADVFGIAEGFARLFRRFSQTSVNVDAVPADVRNMITHWDDPLPEMSLRPVAGDLPFPRDAVEAVDHIARLLGLPHERVVAAVQIAPRTYYGWKTEGRQARPQSLGRLWPMAQAIHYMARAHPNLAAWFNINHEAQALFDAGNFDRLVELELDWALRTYPRRRPIAPEFLDAGVPVGRSADGGDTGNPTVVPESRTATSRPLLTDDVAEVKLTHRNARRS